MKCDDIFELINLYIDNEISDEDNKALFEHISKCDKCKADFEEFERFLYDIKDIGLEELPENYHTELMDKLKRYDNIIDIEDIKSKNLKNNNKKIWYRYMALVASFGFFLVAGIVGVYEKNRDMRNISIYNSSEKNIAENKNDDISSRILEYGNELNKNTSNESSDNNYNTSVISNEEYFYSYDNQNRVFEFVETNINANNEASYNNAIEISKKYTDDIIYNDNNFQITIHYTKYNDFISEINNNASYAVSEYKYDFTNEYKNLLDEFNIIKKDIQNDITNNVELKNKYDELYVKINDIDYKSTYYKVYIFK